jgi:LPS sulfotransferase NodH
LKRSAPDIVAPIILCGTGRCGSTLLHQLLSYHPDLTWLTPLTHVFPRQPWLTRWEMHALDLGGQRGGAFLRQFVWRRFVRPSEAYPFWNAYCENFGPTQRDLVAADLDESCATVRRALARMLTTRRSRLLLKITGWPRAGFLRALFADAKFVHIRRDGRAVANSWLNVDWAGLDGAPDWRWGPLDRDQTARYESEGRSPVALAGIAWEILMNAHVSALGGTALELTYEDLCADPIGTVAQITDFAGLRWTTEFERDVRSTEVRNTNDAWRRSLDEDSQRILENVLAPALARHGYR